MILNQLYAVLFYELLYGQTLTEEMVTKRKIYFIIQADSCDKGIGGRQKERFYRMESLKHNEEKNIKFALCIYCMYGGADLYVTRNGMCRMECGISALFVLSDTMHLPV